MYPSPPSFKKFIFPICEKEDSSLDALMIFFHSTGKTSSRPLPSSSFL